MDETFVVSEGISAIDTKMVGRYLVTSAYLVHSDEPALIETGPQTSATAVKRGLGALGLTAGGLAHIVLTHIHLDHAGGAGTISNAFPNATVWVSDRGAPHLADPRRLVASTERTYGAEQARTMFGHVEPVAAERLRAIGEGDRIRLGNRDLAVMYTPGHASHHVALHDSLTGAVFAGDALGVHLPDVRVLRPATPPPDFDVEVACESIERIRDRADLLLLSHFGPVVDVDRVCALAQKRIRDWSEVVREALALDDDVDRISTLLETQGSSEYREDAGEAVDLQRYDLLSSIRINTMGLVRYWKKRAERDATDPHLPIGPDADKSRAQATEVAGARDRTSRRGPQPS